MRTHILLAAVVFLAVVLFWGVSSLLVTQKDGTKEKKQKQVETVVTIGDARFRVDVADTILARTRGLSGREELEEDEGMFFRFGTAGMYGFWMRGMKFPIDIIWIRDGRIAGFETSVPPPAPGMTMGELPQYLPPEPIDTVLEVNAGTVERYGLQEGDMVTIEENT